MIIVIDGPAGVGKSTTVKAVAQKLNIKYLDSGALYRALAWLFNKLNHDKEAFVKSLDDTSLRFAYAGENFQVFMNEHNITGYLRSKKVSGIVGTVASFPEARAFVNQLMREAVKEGCYIAEGRDLGTAVFPDAALKFFLIAEPHERAQRRLKQLRASGKDVSLHDVLENINRRDQKDINRPNDPLKKADDAIEIDTTKLSFEDQVQQICILIDNKTSLTYNGNR
jgi:cytidylate kinase